MDRNKPGLRYRLRPGGKGFHRNSNRDFMRFLDYSRASVAETISHCYVAIDQGYIGEIEMEHAKEQANVVWKKVNSFITYLNKTEKGEQRDSRAKSTNSTNKTDKTN